MQLDSLKKESSSRFARALLKAAKQLNIDNHFALAKRIKVDSDSVKTILNGGRPNVRTLPRYQDFIKEVTGEIVDDASEPTRFFLRKTGNRRPATLPQVTPRSDLSLHNQLTNLAQVISEFGRLGEALQQQSQLASANLDALLIRAKSLDNDPIMRELLEMDSETRATMSQLLKLLKAKETVALPISKSKKPLSRAQSKTLQKKVTRT